MIPGGARLVLAAVAALALGIAGSVGWADWSSLSSSARAQTADIAVAPGRLLGATRFQVAWLDWDAPRPVFLTALANPSVARDVAALPGLPTALVAVSSPTVDGRNWGVDGSDLLGVDLTTAEGGRQVARPIVMRSDSNESLSWPAWWPDGSALVFQREDQTAPATTDTDTPPMSRRASPTSSSASPCPKSSR